MHKRTVLLMLVICAVVAGVVAKRRQGHLFLNGREDWIRGQIPVLLRFRPKENTKPVVVEVRGTGSVNVEGPEGWIKLKGNEWIYFTSSSSHNLKVADVVLAVDHEGNLYTCNSHVCTNLHLYWPRLARRRKLETVEDFISSVAAPQRLRSRYSPWVKVNEWKTSPPGEPRAER
ncbi:MAG: hypothetical protein HY318_11225 [Armatimonadetes bacterium]|nr:hypothetical protein [Armatimonadota bacterium]